MARPDESSDLVIVDQVDIPPVKSRSQVQLRNLGTQTFNGQD
jgi:hypothetical protein